MSERPPVDASRPSPLRLAGFAVTMTGALLVGIGSIGVWATVGISVENISTEIPGIDLPDGKIALGCAVAMLVGTLATRAGRSGRAAAAWAVVVIAAGTVALAIGGTFLLTGLDRAAVVASLPPPETWEIIEAFRELGLGALLVTIGGALGFVGGILSLAWAMRGRQARDMPAVAEPTD